MLLRLVSLICILLSGCDGDDFERVPIWVSLSDKDDFCNDCTVGYIQKGGTVVEKAKYNSDIQAYTLILKKKESGTVVVTKPGHRPWKGNLFNSAYNPRILGVELMLIDKSQFVVYTVKPELIERGVKK